MRQKRFYTLVGVFVMVAICLVLATAILSYKQYQYAQKETFVMFFKGSLKGIAVSTPVTYRGVKIGEVKRIEITENRAGNNVILPVYVEFFIEKNLGLAKNPIPLLIVNGYVAAISKPNFLNGMADIELIKSVPMPNYKQRYFRGYPIFPSQIFPYKETTLDETLKAAHGMFNELSKFIRSKAMQKAIDSTKAMAISVDKLAANLDNYVPVFISILNQSLEQVSSAAEATKNLMDYLSRYPESLLRGKA